MTTANNNRARPVLVASSLSLLPSSFLTTRFHRRSERISILKEHANEKEDVVSTSPANNKEDVVVSTSPNNKRIIRNVGMLLWITSISAFLVLNFASTSSSWPTALLVESVPRRVWCFIHAVCGMLFSGTIIATTVLEWLVVASQDRTVLQFWFSHVETTETAMVLPALTGSIVSGVAQAFQDYGLLKQAPIHIKGGFHLLLTFGLWWALTDRTTQQTARQITKLQQADADIKNDNHDNLKDNKMLMRVFRIRRWSNVVSCLFVVALYAIMVLKPGLY